MLYLNLYISIVNRKSSWPVLVFNYFFCSQRYINVLLLLSDLRSQYKSVPFVNLSMSSLGIYANSCLSSLKMYDSLSIDNQRKHFLISKLSKISV